MTSNNITPPDSLQPNELVTITEPHYTQLDKQGAMRDNEVIADTALDKAQKPILADANAAITFRLKQEQYRRLWAFKDRYRLDKWKHKDKLKEMKRNRRIECKTARAALLEQSKADRAASREQRQDKQAAKWQDKKDNRIAMKKLQKDNRFAKRDARALKRANKKNNL